MAEQESTDLATQVRQLVVAQLAAIEQRLGTTVDMRLLAPGKMLRTQMAAQISAALGQAVAPPTLVRACAAIELVHTASLCHDDVIDGAPMRRHRPTLWRTSSKASAVLIGDILLCDALELITATENGRFLTPFLAKTREVCEAEAEQELVLRGKPMAPETCVRIARSKTGPLFAFVAQACAGKDERLEAVLEEVGYGIGTIYQLLDDVVDVAGSEALAGKTLGTDAGRGKLTLAQFRDAGFEITADRIHAIAQRLHDLLNPWPAVRETLQDYMTAALLPVVDGQLPEIDICIPLGQTR